MALPLSPLAGNDTSYCESQSIIDITATAQGAGTLAWYSDADLTNLIGTGSSLSPFTTVGSTVYYIVEVNGSCIGTYDSIVVNIDPAPVADFTATPTTGISPLLVDFTDNSTGAGISYSWDFGDGNTYFEQDTMNTYYNSGSFTSVINSFRHQWLHRYLFFDYYNRGSTCSCRLFLDYCSEYLYT